MSFFHPTKSCKSCKKTVSERADTCPHCGISKPGRPCFVATATYGSEFAPEVVLLRKYRDDVLLHNRLGKLFVSFYYKISPPIASWLKNEILLKRTAKRVLDFFVNAVVKESLQKKEKNSTKED